MSENTLAQTLADMGWTHERHERTAETGTRRVRDETGAVVGDFEAHTLWDFLARRREVAENEPWPLEVHVPMTNGDWQNIGAFIYLREAEEHARRLVRSRVVAACQRGGKVVVREFGNG